MKFNYRRNIPPLQNPATFVPRIIIPLHLKRYTIEIASQVDVDADSVPMLVAKHKLTCIGKVLYVHRAHTVKRRRVK